MVKVTLGYLVGSLINTLFIWLPGLVGRPTLGTGAVVPYSSHFFLNNEFTGALRSGLLKKPDGYFSRTLSWICLDTMFQITQVQLESELT